MSFLNVVETLFTNTMRLAALDFSYTWFLVVCVSFNLFQRNLNSLVMKRLRGHRFQVSSSHATHTCVFDSCDSNSVMASSESSSSRLVSPELTLVSPTSTGKVEVVVANSLRLGFLDFSHFVIALLRVLHQEWSSRDFHNPRQLRGPDRGGCRELVEAELPRLLSQRGVPRLTSKANSARAAREGAPLLPGRAQGRSFSRLRQLMKVRSATPQISQSSWMP